MESTEKLNFLPYILVFVRRWRTLVGHFAFVSVVAIAYAFFIVKPDYKSSIDFLPPADESSSLGSLIPGLNLPSLNTSSISPEQIAVVFGSKAIKRKIIDKFNLIKKYKLEKSPAKFELAVKILDKKNLALVANETAGIGFSNTISFSLESYHSSADTACLMANYAFSLLDSAVKAISMDRAHRNRLFAEAQLDKSKLKLDSLQTAMELFQRKNKAYDIPEQAKLTIQAYAELKSQMMVNDIKIQTMTNDFSSETPEMVSLRKANRAYTQKLAQLESQESSDVMPSLSSSVALMPQYVNLLRDNEIQTQLILLLTKETEQAKLQESKNVSTLVVTDPAYKAEYKSRPKRMFLVLEIIAIYLFIILVFYFYQNFYNMKLRDSKLVKQIQSEFSK